MHVTREMLELCEVINSEGFPQSEETPEMKVILFGELFDVRNERFSIQTVNDKQRTKFLFADLRAHQ